MTGCVILINLIVVSLNHLLNKYVVPACSSHRLHTLTSPVASFTEEVNSRLAKRPLIFNGRFAIRGLTSSEKGATGGLCDSGHMHGLNECPQTHTPHEITDFYSVPWICVLVVCKLPTKWLLRFRSWPTIGLGPFINKAIMGGGGGGEEYILPVWLYYFSFSAMLAIIHRLCYFD